jgi:4-amino-4-deoxy-L-arabinose transferase-like glycosyltransferase
MRVNQMEGTFTPRRAITWAIPLTRTNVLRFLPIVAIVAIAAGLRFYDLGLLGYANHYYAAAVKSMLQSWHNFFFVASEPGGAVSVDKPPVGLWIQTVSAYFLGVNTLGLLLPEIISGLASVVVVYHLVRRSFGQLAGLMGALALAVTPVVIATDRNNTIDSILILTLLLAAWAFIIAAERGKLRYVLLGMALVGIGFNIKMLQAYLPLPAFVGLYLLGSKERVWRKIVNMVPAVMVLLVVSFSWAMAVDLTPSSQRPYVGSSGDNTVTSLIFGYNGTERLLGMNGRGGLLGSTGNQSLGGFVRGGAAPQWQGQAPTGGTWQRNGRTGGATGQGGPSTNGTFWQNRQPGGGGFGGGMDTGQAGLSRLFTAPLSKEVSWLLPFGIFSLGLLGFRSRLHWPLALKHQAIIIWGGWLLTGAAFFSIAGFFHQYYLSMLGAPLAALVGIGISELWGLRKRHPWRAAGLFVAAGAATLALQVTTATAFTAEAWWLPIAVGLLPVGALVLAGATWFKRERIAMAGVACMIAAMLITPAIWSGLTALNSSDNQSLPAAYSGQTSGPANSGGLSVNQALLDYLQANTQGSKYLMAVPSSMQGSDYILATGRPVLIMGGFMGQDNVVTAADLTKLAATGDLKYIYWGGGRGMGSNSEITAWVEANCTAVTGFDTQTQNSGAPDGTSAGTSSGTNSTRTGGFGGEMQVALYKINAAG